MPLRSVFSVVFFAPLVAASRRCYQSLDQYPQYLVDCPEEYEHCYKKIKEYGSYWYKEYGCASTATNASWSALINRGECTPHQDLKVNFTLCFCGSDGCNSAKKGRIAGKQHFWETVFVALMFSRLRRAFYYY